MDSFTPKGNGLGHFMRGDGVAASAEVPFTMPGDRVSALLLRKRSGRALGQLQELLSPAPTRVSPPRCVHFGSCGGCRWQHVPYEQQLAQKESWIRHEFSSLLTHKVIFHPIVPCDPPWHYRNKMEFTFSSNAAGTKFIGLILDSSRGRVLNLTECHLTNPWFIEGLTTVRKWWSESGLTAYHPPRDTGSLRTLILREGMRTGDRLAMVTVSGNPDYALKQHHLESLVAFLRETIEPDDPEKRLSIFLRIQQTAKGMATNFYEMHLYGPDHLREQLNISNAKLQFKVSPSAFFQPNSYQAEKLYSLALQHAAISKGNCVYDLYCGTGTLGICASQVASQVVGVELSPESSLDARENAKANGCENVSILTGDVAKVLEEIRTKNSYPLPDVVMVDPPRAGLEPSAIRHLLDLKAPKIVYVSCNPATQAANIGVLVQEGYQLQQVQPVDQFPQTAHVENIALLVRS